MVSLHAWSILGLALALGLSHGADPDHLTAIDGLTRASAERHPTLSRWIGALFALGHSCSVLTVAALIAFSAEHLSESNEVAHTMSPLASALLLIVIGTINLLLFLKASPHPPRGIGSQLLARWLPSNVAHPVIAIPVGALFGLGFDTASQMSAWALAGTEGSGIGGAVMIGAAFSLGMVITDLLNGLIVRRLYLTAAQRARTGGRLMTVAVIGLAYGVGIIKLLQPTSYALPVTDAGLTVIVLGAITITFLVVMRQTKSSFCHERRTL
ncbi:MAG: HoxN/HupN/NixA family nickel/cobalt transporter [Nitrospiraceae bacterium]